MKLDELKAKINKVAPASITPVVGPQGMTIQRFKGVELTVSQLRGLVKGNPDHPVAVDLKPMLAAHSDKRHDVHVITMSQADVEALLTNKEVKIEVIGDTLVDGSVMTEVRKVVGDDLKPAEAPTPVNPSKSK
jgi:hypothetical protein